MAYLKFISMSFQRSISYRVEYFLSVLNAFLYIFIFTSVWSVLVPESAINGAFSKSQMIAYAVLSTLIKASFARNESLLASRVKSGEIAADLLKPFSFPLMYLCDTLGASLYQLLSRAVPLFIFCYFIFDIHIPLDPTLVLRFVPAYLLSFILFFLLSFLISSMAFYFVDIFPFWIFYAALITLASGAIIPIDFFPVGIQKVLLITPFPYLFYFPTLLLLGKPLAFGYDEFLLRYLILIATMLCLCAFSYRGGIRRLTIAGG
ncbi:MAG: ABC-2 family transporter protein [Spirochaetia bacterium]|nr:ABC-2 family transporter protein [Spirochaetia bacterium]